MVPMETQKIRNRHPSGDILCNCTVSTVLKMWSKPCYLISGNDRKQPFCAGEFWYGTEYDVPDQSSGHPHGKDKRLPHTQVGIHGNEQAFLVDISCTYTVIHILKFYIHQWHCRYQLLVFCHFCVHVYVHATDTVKHKFNTCF